MSEPSPCDLNGAQYIGLMSGTSLDGIDGVRTLFAKGKVHILQTAFVPYPETLRQRFKNLLQVSHNELHASQVLAIKHSELSNQAVQQLIQNVEKSAIVAIGNHGQTVRHHPNDTPAYSLQLGNGAYLAELSGITTVMDFRNRDIAAGGQGAPLVAAFHQAIFSSPKELRAIVNIGGVANVSILNCGDAGPIGFDTGPGNTLLDEWAKRHLNTPYDPDGRLAKSGQINAALLHSLMSEPFIAQPPPKSTGRDLFNLNWLDKFSGLDLISPKDVQATLCEYTARSILSSIEQFSPHRVEAIYVAGGGAKNSHLMARLEHLAAVKVDTTTTLGVPPQAVEACAFAWLAKQLLENTPANAPAATGARQLVRLGAIYPA